jgi:hypothetical protein
MTFFANGTQLARENLIIAVTIANRTHGRGGGSPHKRRLWCPVKLEPRREFSSQVFGVGKAATVT